MSAFSAISQRWKQVVVATILSPVEAFAINKVSSDGTSRWWWLLVVGAALGLVACALWASLIRTDESAGERGTNSIEGDVGDGAVVTQQTAGDNGANISSVNGSIAAYRIDKIENLSFGAPRLQPDPDPEEQNQGDVH
jgi:hypothetical protein